MICPRLPGVDREVGKRHTQIGLLVRQQHQHLHPRLDRPVIVSLDEASYLQVAGDHEPGVFERDRGLGWHVLLQTLVGRSRAGLGVLATSEDLNLGPQTGGRILRAGVDLVEV